MVGTLESDAGEVGLTPTQAAALAHVQALAERNRDSATQRGAKVLTSAGIDLAVGQLRARVPAHVVEPFELPEAASAAFWRECMVVAKALADLVSPGVGLQEGPELSARSWCFDADTRA